MGKYFPRASPTCDEVHDGFACKAGRITQVSLRANNLTGSLPDSLCNCKKLKQALAQFNAAVPNAYRVDYQRQFEAAVFGEVESCAPQSDEIEALIEQLGP